MLRPSPNHGTQRLPNDDDDNLDSLPMSATVSVPLSLNVVVSVPLVISLLLKLLLD